MAVEPYYGDEDRKPKFRRVHFDQRDTGAEQEQPSGVRRIKPGSSGGSGDASRLSGAYAEYLNNQEVDRKAAREAILAQPKAHPGLLADKFGDPHGTFDQPKDAPQAPQSPSDAPLTEPAQSPAKLRIDLQRRSEQALKPDSESARPYQPPSPQLQRLYDAIRGVESDAAVYDRARDLGVQTDVNTTGEPFTSGPSTTGAGTFGVTPNPDYDINAWRTKTPQELAPEIGKAQERADFEKYGVPGMAIQFGLRSAARLSSGVAEGYEGTANAVDAAVHQLLPEKYADKLIPGGRYDRDSDMFLALLERPAGVNVREVHEVLDKQPFAGTVADQLGDAFGSTLGFAGAGWLGGAFKGGKYIVPMMMGAAVNAKQVKDEAEHYGASPDDADKAVLLSALVGTSEAVPIGRLFDKFGDAYRIAKGANRASKGQLFKAILTSGITEAGEEATQEFSQQVGNNAIIARYIDENRPLLEGAWESTSTGGAVGGVMGILFAAAGVRQRGIQNRRDLDAAFDEVARIAGQASDQTRANVESAKDAQPKPEPAEAPQETTKPDEPAPVEEPPAAQAQEEQETDEQTGDARPDAEYEKLIAQARDEATRKTEPAPAPTSPTEATATVQPAPEGKGKNQDAIDVFDRNPKPGESIDNFLIRTAGPDAPFLARDEPQPGHVYRGLSRAELKGINRTGKIKSRGKANIGEGQQNKTLFSDSPAQAANYAGAFSLRGFKPRPNRPGYIIELKEPDGATRTEHKYEVEVSGETPASNITRVWEVRPNVENGPYVYKDVTNDFTDAALDRAEQQAAIDTAGRADAAKSAPGRSAIFQSAPDDFAAPEATGEGEGFQIDFDDAENQREVLFDQLDSEGIETDEIFNDPRIKKIDNYLLWKRRSENPISVGSFGSLWEQYKSSPDFMDNFDQNTNLFDFLRSASAQVGGNRGIGEFISNLAAETNIASDMHDAFLMEPLSETGKAALEHSDLPVVSEWLNAAMMEADPSQFGVDEKFRTGDYIAYLNDPNLSSFGGYDLFDINFSEILILGNELSQTFEAMKNQVSPEVAYAAAQLVDGISGSKFSQQVANQEIERLKQGSPSTTGGGGTTQPDKQEAQDAVEQPETKKTDDGDSPRVEAAEVDEKPAEQEGGEEVQPRGRGEGKAEAVVKPASPAEPAGKAEDVPAFSPDLPQYSIYGVNIRNEGGKTMYAVRTNIENPRGGGDELYETPEQARRGADDRRKRDAAKAKAEERNEAERKAKEEAVSKFKAERADIDGFGDDLPAMRRGKVAKNLSGMVKIDGKPDTIRNHVRAMVEAGDVELSVTEEDVIKPMTKAQYHRADNAEQAAHEKKIKGAGTKKVYRVNGRNLGKTAYEYAEHLQAAPADLTKPAETPKETTGIDEAAQVAKSDTLTPESPAKASEPAPKQPWEMSRDEWAKSGDGRDYDKMLWSAYADDKINKDYVESRARTDYAGDKKFWAKTRGEIESDRKSAIKSKREQRAAVNKLGKSGAMTKWRSKSQSNTIKSEIESTNKYYAGLLDVHKERVSEAISDGKPVPEEVLADYPDLTKKAATPKETKGTGAQAQVKQPSPAKTASKDKQPSAPESAQKDNKRPPAQTAPTEGTTEPESGTTPTHRLVDKSGKVVSEHLSERAAKGANDRAGGIYKVKQIEASASAAGQEAKTSPAAQATASEDLTQLTKKDLAKRMKGAGLKPKSSMTKAQMVEALETKDREPEATEKQSYTTVPAPWHGQTLYAWKSDAVLSLKKGAAKIKGRRTLPLEHQNQLDAVPKTAKALIARVKELTGEWVNVEGKYPHFRAAKQAIAQAKKDVPNWREDMDAAEAAKQKRADEDAERSSRGEIVYRRLSPAEREQLKNTADEQGMTVKEYLKKHNEQARAEYEADQNRAETEVDKAKGLTEEAKSLTDEDWDRLNREDPDRAEQLAIALDNNDESAIPDWNIDEIEVESVKEGLSSEQDQATKVQADGPRDTQAEGSKAGGGQVAPTAPQEPEAKTTGQQLGLTGIGPEGAMDGGITGSKTKALFAPAETESKADEADEQFREKQTPKDKETSEMFADKEPWELTPKEYASNSKGVDEKAVSLAAHPQHVKKALEEGRPVPDRVLDAYKNNGWAAKELERRADTSLAAKLNAKADEALDNFKKNQIKGKDPRARGGSTIGKDIAYLSQYVAYKTAAMGARKGKALVDAVKQILGEVAPHYADRWKDVEKRVRRLHKASMNDDGTVDQDRFESEAALMVAEARSPVKQPTTKQVVAKSSGREAVKDIRKKKIKLSEKDLIRERFRQRAKRDRAVEKAEGRMQRQLDRLKNKEIGAAEARKTIVNIVKNNLPSKMRGRYLNAAAKAKTERDIERVVERIRSDIQRQSRAELVKMVRNAAQRGGITRHESKLIIRMIYDGASMKKIGEALQQDRITEKVEPESEPGFYYLPPGRYRQALANLQDRMREAWEVQKAIERGTGNAVDEASDVYLAEELRTRKTQNRIERAYERNVRPITQVLGRAGIPITTAQDKDPKGDELPSFNTYVIARHAKERNKAMRDRAFGGLDQVIPGLAGDPNFGSGMSDELAQQILDTVDGSKLSPQYKKAARLFDRLNRNYRDVLRESGLESSETLDSWAKMFKAYAPLRTDMTALDPALAGTIGRTGKGINIRGKEQEKAKGRRSIADDPLGFAWLNLQSGIIRAEKNRVGQTFLKLAEANPNENVWKILRGDDKPGVGWETVGVKVGGEEIRIAIAPQHIGLAKALKNLGQVEMFWGLNHLASATRTLAALLTRWNPVFPPINLIRDVNGVALTVTGEHGAVDAAKVTKNITPAFWALYDQQRSGVIKRHLPPNEQKYWKAVAREYRDSGAPIAILNLSDLSDTSRRLGRELKAAKAGKHPLNAIRSALLSVGDYISDLNDAAENATRMSVYAMLRQKGWSKAKAASYAKSISTNFERKGNIGGIINSLYYFSNAAIQGNARVIESVVRHKGTRKVVGGLFVASAGLHILNYMMAGEDDDGENYYAKMPDHVKRNNIILPIWDDEGNAVMIPAPFVYNFVQSLAQGVTDATMGHKTPFEVSAYIGAAAFETFNPVGGDISDPIYAATPSVIKPFVEIDRNRDWMQNPIYPDEPYATYKKPDSELTMKSTPEWLKKAAQFANRQTGGNQFESGWLDVSPDSISHLIEFYTGGLGKTISRTENVIEKKLTGKPVDTYEVPLLRRFRYSTNPRLMADRFYDDYKANIERLSDMEEAGLELTPMQKDLLGLRGSYNRKTRRYTPDSLKWAQKQLETLRKERDAHEYQSPEWNAVDERIDAVYARFNKRYAETAEKHD